MHGSELGRWHRRARVGTAAVGLVVALTALTACDSGGGSTTASTIVPATPATTAPPTVQTLSGNLRITGDSSVALPDATGECRLHPKGLPKEFVVRSSALGINGFVAVFGPMEVPGRGPIPANVKVYAGGKGYVSPTSGTGVTVAPDQQSATVDVDVTGVTGGSRNGALITTGLLKAHITGRLRCR
jgi:hypothetical protein